MRCLKTVTKMNTPEQRTIGSLKVPDFHSVIFGTCNQDDLQVHAEDIQASSIYTPLMIANNPDSDGKYPVLKGVRTFLAARDILKYEVMLVIPVDVPAENQPMEMLRLNERRIVTRRMLVNMLPVFEEYYERVIRPTRPNNRDHERDKTVWISGRFKLLGTPIGLRNVEKLKYINENRPALLDLLGVENPIHPVWKKLYDEVNGKEAKVTSQDDTSAAENLSDGESKKNQSDDADDENEISSPHGQEDAMRTYFGKQFCNTCRANWIWFNKLNPIEPVEGGNEL